MDKIDQITLDCLVNRTQYKKYVKQHQHHDTELYSNEQSILYKNIAKHRTTINNHIQSLLNFPQNNAKIQEYFESFIEVLFKEEEVEVEEEEEEIQNHIPNENNFIKDDQDDFDRNAEDEDDALFENIPEHQPTEIEYWKMQTVFKMPSTSK